MTFPIFDTLQLETLKSQSALGTDSSGNVIGASPFGITPTALLVNTSATSIPTSTWTQVNCQSVSFDTTTMSTTANLLTARVSGYYSVSVTVEWTYSTLNVISAVGVLRNGSIETPYTVATAVASNGGGYTQTYEGVFYFNSGDTIACGAFQNSGGSVNTAPVGSAISAALISQVSGVAPSIQGTDILQNGVIGAGDLQISGMSVSSIGATTFTWASGVCWILVNGALIRVPVVGSSTTLTPTIPTSSGDYIGVGIEMDSVGTFHLISGTNNQTTQAAALANITGTATTAGRVRVRDYVIQGVSGSCTLSTTGYDRRPWARGFFNKIIPASVGGPFTSNTFTSLGTAWQLRVECTGNPLRLRTQMPMSENIVGANIQVGFMMDGTAITNEGPFSQAVASDEELMFWGDTYTPTAGSHLFVPCVLVNTGSLTVVSGYNWWFEIEEIVRQNTNNGTA